MEEVEKLLEEKKAERADLVKLAMKYPKSSFYSEAVNKLDAEIRSIMETYK